MFVPKLYRNQHLVLGESYNSPSVNQFPDVEQIAVRTNLAKDDVMQAAYLLKGKGYVHVNRDKKPFIVACSPEGAQAYLQKKLLEEGKEKGKAELLRWIQIMGIVTASFIGLATFVNNLIKTDDNAARIKVLELKVHSMRE
ncbi:hypothetical protein KBK19_06890 [Microvirga sp. STR05]|uniref:MarR family transcriptional regulator n=1 Tax=Hymenobacter duratus TaxID=2771356 RepID=A0ABR8JD50_9BACT|nr:hypothetical protein [Hymenobacter duratus]MBD2714754.1 hypothetical protein [Hymenobacter duratus]MBR7949659.1 hypothetical protein [Microvirga sp. STR05]